ncbi:MAG TPA: FeoB small GTPase domain-containing protein, partial [Longimicrobiales bacterium]|nr:FeoB small GTPase domain-containing protein [Longimicrobiales bacterium]
MSGPSPGGVAVAEGEPSRSASPSRRPLVALIGPPNSGKTTLFNQLTGLRQKVANYPGVTVEKHVGVARLPHGGEVELVDLPGLHGFSARTLDERVTRDVLEGRAEGLRAPDALVLIVDSTRLEPQLMLVEPVLELDLPTLLVLNMSDELERRGGEIDDEALAAELGVEVCRANARAGEGLDRIRDFLSGAARRGRLPDRPAREARNVSGRRPLPVMDAFADRRRRIREAGEKARFRPPGPSRVSEKLDSIFLHKVWGPLVFFGVVLLVFQSIFTWAVPLMDGVELLVDGSGQWLAARLPQSWFWSLLIDGVWAGVG